MYARSGFRKVGVVRMRVEGEEEREEISGDSRVCGCL